MTIRERARVALERAKEATPGPWIREMVQDGEILPDGTGYAGDWYESNAIERAAGPDNNARGVAECGSDADAIFVAAARTDVDDFAAHILRITSPEMRERIAQTIRTADVGQRLWGADVQDLTAAIMGLLTEEPCDST